MKPTLGRIIHVREKIYPVGDFTDWQAAIVCKTYQDGSFRAKVFSFEWDAPIKTMVFGIDEEGAFWRWPPREEG